MGVLCLLGVVDGLYEGLLRLVGLNVCLPHAICVTYRWAGGSCLLLLCLDTLSTLSPLNDYAVMHLDSQPR